MLKQFKINISFVIASRLTVIITRLLSIYILTRVLGTSGYGLYSFLISLLVIGSLIGNVGFGYSNVFFISKSEIEIGKALGNSFLLSLINGILVGICVQFLPIIFKNMFIDTTTYLMIILGLTMIFYIYYSFITDVINGLELFSLYYLSFSLLWIINFITIGFLYYFERLNVTSAFTAFSMSTLLSLVVIFIILKKKLNIKLTFSISDIKRQIKYGLPLYFRDFFNQVNFRFIHLIIKNYYNSSVLGVFALASQAAEVLLYIPRAGFTVLFPHFSKEEINKGRLIKKSLKYFSVIFSLILLTSYFIVPFIIKRFFSSEFLGSILIFRILLVGIFSIGLLNIIESFLLGSYKQNIIMISSGISAITLIVASIILIPKFGIIGAAVITSSVFVLYLLITCFIYFRKCSDKKSFIEQVNHFIHD